MDQIPDTKHPLDSLDGEAKEKFRIKDDDAAAWAMRKLRAIRSKQAQNSQIYVDEVARLDVWLTEVNGPLDNNAAYFETLLRTYAIECRENKDDGRKSLTLPTGKVTTRVASPKWEVDSDVVLAWAKQNNLTDLVRVKEELSVSALKEFAELPFGDLDALDKGIVITTDGEVIPGVRVSHQEVSVTVTPDIK